MPRFHFHKTVTSALQTVTRLARSSPYYAELRVPITRAEAVSDKLARRFPTIYATHTTRTALRKAKVPALHLVVMPPEVAKGEVVMLLLSNLIPENSGEMWRLCLDPEQPLIWRNYELTKLEDGRITWKLSEVAERHYRKRLARLITGRGGLTPKGKRPYQLPDATAYQQVLLMARHLNHYPGLAGVRRSVFALAQHSTRMWKATRPHHTYPTWPTMPYVRLSAAQTAPLSELQEFTHAQKKDQSKKP